MRLRAVIVDDELLARVRLRTLLAASDDVAVVAEAENVSVAAGLIEQLEPDMVFLDIQMPDDSGIALVRTLTGASQPVVVFTTAHPQYALDAFEVNAADYLVKPLDAERVLRAVERARRRIAGGTAAARTQRPSRERLAVRTRGEIVFVKAGSVDWIAAEGNYSRLYVRDHTYIIRESLQSLEESLDPATFLRVHRSAIVNLDRARKLVTSADGSSMIMLSTGQSVPLGPSYRSRFEQVLGQKL